jgi:hypothetical protein
LPLPRVAVVAAPEVVGAQVLATPAPVRVIIAAGPQVVATMAPARVFIAVGNRGVATTAPARVIMVVGTADMVTAIIPTATGGDSGSPFIQAGGGPIPILIIPMLILIIPILIPIPILIRIMHLHQRLCRKLPRTANHRKNSPTTGITARIHKVTTRMSRPAQAAG